MSLWKNPNSVTLGGRLVRDPETRQFDSGTVVCNFALANNRMINKEGERAEDSHFFEVKAYGKNAENIARYFKKGDPIIVEGEIRQERWEDTETKQTRSRVVVVVNSWFFNSQNKNSLENETVARSSFAPTASAERPPAAFVPNSSEDDDIPF